ncbi:predicted protein [Verticillium alfalfae VaMs.102]|uniref:Predicted protein n=1 Tax=Verticillium alfalfae (strain VaMs.102 / ATCC MYA-4576 / FGSC 10136) TaxID=526221 RepID=C9S982_VERA1|nr:predicted protein [Verticillium alfalfae VaMs.102]EEY14985.1 predicted protein [Verticillium alfalfae VaMs.102]
MAHKSLARILPDRDLESAYASYDKNDRVQLGKTATTIPNDGRQIHRPERKDESRRKKSSSGGQPVDSQDITTTTGEAQLTGRTVPRAYPPCDACVTRGRSCSQYRPCASCHGAGDTCSDSRALHALGNLEPPGRKRKLGGLTDEQGRPIKRGRMEVLKDPCASCAAAGTAVPCDADHRLRIECTACADVRAVRDPDHKCVVAETAVYMPKRSRWTRAPYSNIAQVVHWGCEGCRGRSYRCAILARPGGGGGAGDARRGASTARGWPTTATLASSARTASTSRAKRDSRCRMPSSSASTPRTGTRCASGRWKTCGTMGASCCRPRL